LNRFLYIKLTFYCKISRQRVFAGRPVAVNNPIVTITWLRAITVKKIDDERYIKYIYRAITIRIGGTCVIRYWRRTILIKILNYIGNIEYVYRRDPVSVSGIAIAKITTIGIRVSVNRITIPNYDKRIGITAVIFKIAPAIAD
jgi:hypothetical protein